MKFYISKSDLQKVWDGCDLGDSVRVHVYQYPHRDMMDDLAVCLSDFDPIRRFGRDPAVEEKPAESDG